MHCTLVHASNYVLTRPTAHRIREILSSVGLDISSDRGITSTSTSHATNNNIDPGLLREQLASLADVASELGLAVATEGSMNAAWGQLCLEDMKVSRLQVRGWSELSQNSRQSVDWNAIESV